MIAEVIPILRLPRGFEVFDYRIPEELCESAKLGLLVSIPFRGKTIFGVIANVKEKTTSPASTLKSISSFVHATPLLSGQHLSYLRTLSAWYGISVPTAAKLFLPPLHKRKLKTQLFTPFPARKKRAAPPQIFHWYSNDAEHIACLDHATQGTTLILAPTIHDAEEIARLLPAPLQKDTMVWHSELSPKEQYAKWWAVRNGETKIIIGTRSAVFLPFPRLDSVIVDFEHHPEHKHWDQTPRYHVNDVAQLFQTLYGSALHRASFSLSFHSYHDLYQKELQMCESHENVSGKRPLFAPTKHGIETINMRDERTLKNYSALSASAVDAIRETRGDILLYINRIGFATSVGCHDCGFIARCRTCELPLVYHEQTRTMHCHYCGIAEPLPPLCPHCQSPLVQLRGTGTETIEVEIRKYFEDTLPHHVIRIDSEAEEPSDLSEEKPRLLIGTDMALPFVRWDCTELVVFVDIDKQLALPEYTATEDVWHLVQEVLFRKRKQARFLIQTFHTDHLLFKSLAEKDRMYRTELGSRRALHYPPYTYVVRYLAGDSSPEKGKARAATLFRSLTEGVKNPMIVHAPVETHPKFYRGNYWQTLFATLPQDSWMSALPELNARIPSDWKIDPHPTSLLQP